jgi:hypothetical protein
MEAKRRHAKLYMINVFLTSVRHLPKLGQDCELGFAQLPLLDFREKPNAISSRNHRPIPCPILLELNKNP